jgi:hypothetical protein
MRIATYHLIECPRGMRIATYHLIEYLMGMRVVTSSLRWYVDIIITLGHSIR